VKWDDDAGISLKTHSDYIKEFAETFYEQVKLLIDRNQEKRMDLSYLNKQNARILQEVLDHASFCNETVAKFQGRTDLLEKVYDQKK
jgi:hypothetical protein